MNEQEQNAIDDIFKSYLHFVTRFGVEELQKTDDYELTSFIVVTLKLIKVLMKDKYNATMKLIKSNEMDDIIETLLNEAENTKQ